MSLPLHRWMGLALVWLGASLVSAGGATGDRAAAVDRHEPGTAPRAVVVSRGAGGAVDVAMLVQAAGAQVVKQPAFGNSVPVPRHVDRQDPVQSFAVLTPLGPLVIRARMTIDGKPFREATEAIVDNLLRVIGADGENKVAWEEAMRQPRFTLGRLGMASFAGLNLNPQQREQLLQQQKQQIAQWIKTFDADGDTLVDRYEVRLMVARLFNGAALIPNTMAAFRNTTVDLFTLLDADKDGSLSADEIDAAPQRLKSLDADDNDLLYVQELGVNPAGAAGGQPAAMSLVPLGGLMDADALLAALVQRYGDAQQQVTAKTLRLPGLFAALDANQDGHLDPPEAQRLDSVPPHAELAIDFEGGGVSRIKCLATADTLQHSLPDGGGVLLTAAGLRVHVTTGELSTRQYNDALAQQQVARLDKNNNGYLEADEIDNDSSRQMVAAWDVDGDGRVYPKEIAAYYESLQAPAMASIWATATVDHNALFRTLDETGDRRLSLREMRTAATRLRTLDANGDGQLTAEEVPVTMQVTLSRGGFSGYGYTLGTRDRLPGGGGSLPAAQGPEWFVRMDRNGDGDVTLKEFLGTEEQFRKLDRNGDGFIERSEAEAASKP